MSQSVHIMPHECEDAELMGDLIGLVWHIYKSINLKVHPYTILCSSEQLTCITKNKFDIRHKRMHCHFFQDTPCDSKLHTDHWYTSTIHQRHTLPNDQNIQYTHSLIFINVEVLLHHIHLHKSFAA